MFCDCSIWHSFRKLHFKLLIQIDSICKNGKPSWKIENPRPPDKWCRLVVLSSTFTRTLSNILYELKQNGIFGPLYFTYNNCWRGEMYVFWILNILKALFTSCVQIWYHVILHFRSILRISDSNLFQFLHVSTCFCKLLFMVGPDPIYCTSGWIQYEESCYYFSDDAQPWVLAQVKFYSS